MMASQKTTTKPLSDEQRLRNLVSAYAPSYRRLILSVRKILRSRFPSANELVYDYAKGFVMSWSPNERGSDAVVAISAGADGLRLVFNQGPTLPDPKKILLGSGRQTRYIWVESPTTLNRPEVKALLKSATARMKLSLRPNGRGRLVVKSATTKQRPTKS